MMMLTIFLIAGIFILTTLTISNINYIDGQEQPRTTDKDVAVVVSPTTEKGMAIAIAPKSGDIPMIEGFEIKDGTSDEKLEAKILFPPEHYSNAGPFLLLEDNSGMMITLKGEGKLPSGINLLDKYLNWWIKYPNGNEVSFGTGNNKQVFLEAPKISKTNPGCFEPETIQYTAILKVFDPSSVDVAIDKSFITLGKVC